MGLRCSKKFKDRLAERASGWFRIRIFGKFFSLFENELEFNTALSPVSERSKNGKMLIFIVRVDETANIWLSLKGPNLGNLNYPKIKISVQKNGFVGGAFRRNLKMCQKCLFFIDFFTFCSLFQTKYQCNE